MDDTEQKTYPDQDRRVFAKSPIAAEEEKILKFWRENRIFEKTLAGLSGDKELPFWKRFFGRAGGRKEFVFYEGLINRRQSFKVAEKIET